MEKALCPSCQHLFDARVMFQCAGHPLCPICVEDGCQVCEEHATRNALVRQAWPYLVGIGLFLALSLWLWGVTS